MIKMKKAKTLKVSILTVGVNLSVFYNQIMTVVTMNDDNDSGGSNSKIRPGTSMMNDKSEELQILSSCKRKSQGGNTNDDYDYLASSIQKEDINSNKNM